jgi:acyl-CoA synthetase (AMP-forming)/AMP-acid ligase II
MPNFAFAFLAQGASRTPRPARDLSSVRAWINCSEPIQSGTVERFLEAFAGDGVRDASLGACYALAENVFAATQSRPGPLRRLRVDREALSCGMVREAPDGRDSITLVSCGDPLPTTGVRIVGPTGEASPAMAIGEIQVRGEHLFAGYFHRPDLTEASHKEGWFATGDLGFLWDGELYVTGRAKDLIIVQGRNFYPGDIEHVVGELPGVAPGRVVAFGVPDPSAGTEQLIVLAEPSADEPSPMLPLQIRARVAEAFALTPHDVRVVPRRWLVKSTSGKLARRDNRDKYLRHVHGS